MSKFRDLEYCKIDLIAAKGIVFVKYAKSSSALLALESILANDCMVSPTSSNFSTMPCVLRLQSAQCLVSCMTSETCADQLTRCSP